VRKALLAVAALLVAAAGATAWAISRPDPRTESLLDGCARSRQAEFAREASSWVYVGDRNAAARAHLTAAGYERERQHAWESPSSLHRSLFASGGHRLMRQGVCPSSWQR